MNLQQVKSDLENSVMVSDSTWKQVLATALELSKSRDQLAAALKMAQRGMAQVGVQDHMVDYDFHKKVVATVDVAIAATSDA